MTSNIFDPLTYSLPGLLDLKSWAITIHLHLALWSSGYRSQVRLISYALSLI